MTNVRPEHDTQRSKAVEGAVTGRLMGAFAAVSNRRFWTALGLLAIADLTISWLAVRQGGVAAGRSDLFDLWDETKLVLATAAGFHLYRRTRAALAAVLSLLPLTVMLNGVFSLHIRGARALQEAIDLSALRAIVPISTSLWYKTLVLGFVTLAGGALIWSTSTSSRRAAQARILLTLLFAILVAIGPAFEMVEGRTGFHLDLGFTVLDMGLLEETSERAVESAILATLWAFAGRAEADEFDDALD